MKNLKTHVPHQKKLMSKKKMKILRKKFAGMKNRVYLCGVLFR
jgi:hypothetical protein